MSESLKSREMIAALRALPEARPESIHGVAAYREAADAVERLENELCIAQTNMQTARGHIALAVQRDWADNEIPASVREFLGMPGPLMPAYITEFGTGFRVPPGIPAVRGTRDASWRNDACPSFTLAACEDTGCEVRLWCDSPKPTCRDGGASHRFECVLTVPDYDGITLWGTDDPRTAVVLWRATAGLTDPWSRYAGMTGAALVTEARELGRRICIRGGVA